MFKIKLHLLTDERLKQLIQNEIKASNEKHATDLQLEIIKKQISLSSLQSQINPHFLYNALECVRGQAIIDHAPVIVDMVQAISNYFRYSISSKSDIVTLNDEINNVKNYLKIQQFRFSNRFRVDFSYASDDILEAIIPKLTLQPIIENSIQHGFEKSLGEAKIKIEIIATQKNINILISDNGLGMDKETLKRLNDKIVHYDVIKDNSSRHTGVAIPNIDKRLKMLFGEEYGIHIASLEGIGTDVEIHIPKLYELESS